MSDKKPVNPVFKWSVPASLVIVAAGFLGTFFDTPTLNAQNMHEGPGPSVSQQQGPPDLEALKQRMRPLFELDGVVFTDADEARGRLVVGVLNRGLARSVEARLATLGVPLQLVDIRETAPIIELATLRDRTRPIVGGLEIQFVKFPFLYMCTLGFNAVRGADSGFVTNSHCTTKRSSVDGTNHYQAAYDAANLIGTEIADPPFLTGGVCPRRMQCRYSDSVFSRVADGVGQSRGEVARVDAPGSVNIVGKYQVSGEAASNGLVGEVLNKVGRTTGWTQGAVTNSCVDTTVSGTKILMLCQDFVAAGSGGGDSGSPVFKINPDGSVTLYGILWGGDTAGTMFVHSPMANIQRVGELGPLNTCAASC